MSTKPLDVFNTYNDALVSGQLEDAFAVFADDVIWHQPGQNPLSGTIVGKEKLGAHLAQFGEKSNGTFRVLTNWVSENDNLVAANVTFQAERGDDILDMNGIDLFRIENGLIKEIWLFSANQLEEDKYWT